MKFKMNESLKAPVGGEKRASVLHVNITAARVVCVYIERRRTIHPALIKVKAVWLFVGYF